MITYIILALRLHWGAGKHGHHIHIHRVVTSRCRWWLWFWFENVMEASNYYLLMSKVLMLVRFVCEQLTEDSIKLLWNVTLDLTDNNMEASQITATNFEGSNPSQASSWTVTHYPPCRVYHAPHKSPMQLRSLLNELKWLTIETVDWLVSSECEYWTVERQAATMSRWVMACLVSYTAC